MGTLVRTISAAVLLACVAPGCVWSGFRAESAGVAVFNSPTIEAFLYQPNSGDRAALEDALSSLTELYQDAAFRQRFLGLPHPLLADPRGERCVTGAEVVSSVLGAHYSGVHIVVNRPALPHTVAVTMTDPNRISVSIGRVSGLNDLQLGLRYGLVNTLAHELTHTVADGATERLATDTAESSTGSPDRVPGSDPHLLSYAVGNMAQCHLVATDAGLPGTEPHEAAYTRCMAHCIFHPGGEGASDAWREAHCPSVAAAAPATLVTSSRRTRATPTSRPAPTD